MAPVLDLTVDILRQIRDSLDALQGGQRRIEVRIASIERQLGEIDQRLGGQRTDIGLVFTLMTEMDERLGRRLDRIDHALGLIVKGDDV